VEKNELTLTSDEQTELIRLETIIENGRKSFIEVGTALIKIRDSRLYRKDYKTFEEYCKGKWQYARRTAYQLIDSVKVFENRKARKPDPLRGFTDVKMGGVLLQDFGVIGAGERLIVAPPQSGWRDPATMKFTLLSLR
jgi:hypothetical protein